MPTLTIPLTRDKVAIIDADSLPIIAGYRWYAAKPKAHHGNRRTWYAQAIARVDGKSTTVLMHRLIIGAEKGEKVDHKNGNGLDNRRDNLRLATSSQNTANTPPPATNTSGYKGVHFHRRNKTWEASVVFEGARRHLGKFESPEDAARAYDAAAIEIWGEYAWTNFDQEVTV